MRILIMLMVIISCKESKTDTKQENPFITLEKIINQKLASFNIKVCIPNTVDTTEIYDSLFYKTEFNSMIKYSDSCIVIKNLTVKDSTKMFIEFNLQESQYGLKDVSFYNFNNTIRFIYITDTSFQNIDTKITCNEIRKTYNTNGKLLEINYYGYYGPWGVPVGTSKQYNLEGDIIKETSYEYWKERDGKKTTIQYDDKGIKDKILIEQYDAHYGEGDTIKYWKNN